MTYHLKQTVLAISIFCYLPEKCKDLEHILLCHVDSKQTNNYPIFNNLNPSVIEEYFITGTVKKQNSKDQKNFKKFVKPKTNKKSWSYAQTCPTTCSIKAIV